MMEYLVPLRRSWALLVISFSGWLCCCGELDQPGIASPIDSSSMFLINGRVCSVREIEYNLQVITLYT